jgi:hypothetical protein
MSNVVDMTERLPHGAHYVACMDCAHDWVAVAPVNVSWPLECPRCGEKAGERVDSEDANWFMRFMAGRDQKKRTFVVLNAKRIEGIT